MYKSVRDSAEPSDPLTTFSPSLGKGTTNGASKFLDQTGLLRPAYRALIPGDRKRVMQNKTKQQQQQQQQQPPPKKNKNKKQKRWQGNIKVWTDLQAEVQRVPEGCKGRNRQSQLVHHKSSVVS